MSNGVEADNKVLLNPEIRIEGNAITSKRSIIQISNISRAWAGPVPPEKMSALKLTVLAVSGVLGALLLSNNWKRMTEGSSSGGVMVLLGLGLWGIAAYIIYNNLNRPNYYAINLELNSNSVYSFTSTKAENINKIFEVISRILIENNDNENILINFGNGAIINNSENVIASAR